MQDARHRLVHGKRVYSADADWGISRQLLIPVIYAKKDGPVPVRSVKVAGSSSGRGDLPLAGFPNS